LRLFIEHAPAALAMFDCQMRYLSVSQRWLEDYGLSGQNLLGRSHYEVFPETSERWKEFHRRGLAGEVLREDADRFERADGRVRWIYWEIRPWHDAAGTVGGIVVFSTDITELYAANEELTKFNRLMVDREVRMIELKEEINALCEEVGKPARYEMSAAEEPG